VSRKITVRVDDIKADAELNDSEAAQKIWETLPIKSKVSIWGNEIYFPIPIKIGLEDAKAVVSEGDLGYWLPGTAFCIFFGPTPMSQGNEIRPASPVNVFGRIVGDSKVFKKVTTGAKIIVEKAE